MLLTASGKVLRLLDSATGRVIYSVPCEYNISSLVFVGDGRTFVVGGREGQVSVWHTGSGQRLFDICNLGTRVFYLDSYGDGFLAGTRGISDDRLLRCGSWCLSGVTQDSEEAPPPQICRIRMRRLCLPRSHAYWRIELSRSA
jgi:hypothetical protein